MMMSRKEMMEKLAMASDVELEGALRSIELQRELNEFAKKDKSARIEEAKTKLTKISISVVGAVSADNSIDLISEMNKMQTAIEEAKKESPEGCITIEKFNINCSAAYATSNFIVNIDLDKDQITQMNNKIGRAFF